MMAMKNNLLSQLWDLLDIVAAIFVLVAFPLMILQFGEVKIAKRVINNKV